MSIQKISTLIVFGLILSMSGCLDFFSNFDLDPVIMRANPYLNKVSLGDEYLASYARSLLSEASCVDDACIVNTLYRHVVTTYEYIPDPEGSELIKSPQETILDGGGDCEDLTILLISLLENVDIHTYLVLTDTHAYGLAYGINGSNLWIYAEESLLEQVENDHGTDIHKLYHDTTTINKKSHFYLGGNGSKIPDDFEYLEISYKISSTRPLDIQFVASRDDFNNSCDNKPYEQFHDCAHEHVLDISDSCEVGTSRGGIMLSNTGWTAAEVSYSIEFYYKPSFYSLFGDNEIVSYRINNISCVVLDPTAGSYGFPGFDADIIGEKIAIHTQTKEYVYLK